MTTPHYTGPFDRAAEDYHGRLPGFIRATLVDHGISAEVVERRQLGWDGTHVTIPIRDESGRVVLFERWDAGAVGVPLRFDPAELFPRDVLTPTPDQIVVAEGVHDALVFESYGIRAVTATGSGLALKLREWGPLIGRVPQVVLAYCRGERRLWSRPHLSRSGTIEKALGAFPQARLVAWPEEVGEGGGAYAYFVLHRRTREDFERLLHEPNARQLRGRERLPLW